MPTQQNKTEHILACLSSAPSNAKIIETASQMAKAFGGKLTALYVKTPSADSMSRENRERLTRHIRMAEDLGAEIVTVYGEDIPQQITEFARVSKVTKVVLGRSNVKAHTLISKKSLSDRLVRTAPELDIHIIPDFESNRKHRFHTPISSALKPSIKNIAITLLVLLLSTAVGYLFDLWKFTEANTITVYLLGALLTALFTKNYLCSGAFSLISVLLFNFFLTEPRLSFKAYDTGYPVTVAIMFIVSLLTGMLANKIASNARLSANTAYRTSILLETNRLLQTADTEEGAINVLAGQISKMLPKNIIIYPIENGNLGEPLLFPQEKNDTCKMLFTAQERAAVTSVLKNSTHSDMAQAKTKDALCTYFLMRSGKQILSVIGIQTGEKKPEPFENSILTSMLGECALTIEKLRAAKEKEEIALRAKNEQLRANLLRAISHDLRTPLTSISGNAENLLVNFEKIDEETRIKLLTDVSDDAEWLISLVENLLSISRISEGRMNIRMSAQLVDEVVDEAIRHVNKKAKNHIIFTDCGEEILLAEMDARLISQVIINLVDNAVKYTPEGSEIKVTARDAGEHIAVSVADNGGGIPDEQKGEVFKMFYTGKSGVADCHRSLGLGLSLCESIVSAHGGKLALTDNQPHGCIFTFTLKKSEVTLNE